MLKAVWIGLSAIVVLFALIASVLVIDAIGRILVLKGKTEFRTVKSSSTSNSRRLFVYFPGILADGVTSSLNLQPVWLEHGDLLLVSYKGERFIASEVVESTIAKLRDMSGDYDEVVFIGSSMGGLLSYDTAVELDKSEHAFDVKLILIDAPTKGSDLQAPLDKVSLGAWLVGGPLTNKFSGRYFDMTFRPPAEENIEDGVDRNELGKRVEEAKSFPLSTHNDWIRYIRGHGPLKAGTLQRYDGVYIRSERDHDTVRPRAFTSWHPVFGTELQYMELDSTHTGYNERPKIWQAGFRKAFRMIGIS